MHDMNDNLPERVMSRIKEGRITMKPRWYFVLGSAAMILGLIGAAVASSFLISLVTFSLRTHGPMGAVRFERLLSSFPWWAPIAAVAGIGFGVWLLRKYDFSYRKNFPSVIAGFIIAIVLAGVLVNYSGLDAAWMEHGRMRQFYERYDGRMPHPGMRMMQDGNFLNQNPPGVRR